MSKYSEIPDGILKLTNNRPARLALSSFVISALVTGFAVLISSFSYQNNQLKFSVPSQLYIAYIVMFIILFLTIWIILYLLTRKDINEVYEIVRKSICGDWTVTYAANKGPLSDEEIVPARSIPCKIDVTPENKLVMIFKIIEIQFLKMTIAKSCAMLQLGIMTRVATHFCIIIRGNGVYDRPFHNGLY